MTTPTTSTTMDKNLDAACAVGAGEIARTTAKLPYCWLSPAQSWPA
ncbi:hypothetical protein [Streptomyces phaeoluteigriseus]